MENINLMKLLDAHNVTLLLDQALHADKAEAERIIQATENAWNAGEVFAPMSIMTCQQRTPENEAAEMDAMLTQVKGRLESLVLGKWAAAMGREQAVAVCNALASLMLGANIAVGGIKLTAYDVADAWSCAHPDEKKISPATSFEN